jgi:ABC-type sugar transport system substrate-binding protein
LGNAYFVGNNKAVPAGMQAQLLTAVFEDIDVNRDKTIHYMVLTDAGDFYQQTLEERAPNTAQRLELFQCQTGEEAKAFCASAFTKYGRDLELIICSSDALALGAAAAVRENGRIPGEDVLVMGVGATEEGLAAVQNGYLLCTIGEDTQGIYNRLLQTVQKLVKSTPVNQKNYVNHTVYLTEN